MSSCCKSVVVIWMLFGVVIYLVGGTLIALGGGPIESINSNKQCGKRWREVCGAVVIIDMIIIMLILK